MQKNLKVEKEKSEIEEQYEELFSPVISKTKVKPASFIQQSYSEEFVTWVTYGAFEDPIR